MRRVRSISKPERDALRAMLRSGAAANELRLATGRGMTTIRKLANTVRVEVRQ